MPVISFAVHCNCSGGANNDRSAADSAGDFIRERVMIIVVVVVELLLLCSCAYYYVYF